MRRSNYFKTMVAIVLIIAIILGFFFGLQFGLHTSDPLLTVESGSMSIPYDGMESKNWQGFWLSITHPLDRTLSVGDIIIIQGVNTKDLNTNYPNSDIIVFHSPITGELIVHRIIGTKIVNGTTYFFTKGDGNGYPDTWPQIPKSLDSRSGVDSWDYMRNPPGVPQNLVVGKVIMRIPWFGWITLEMKDNPWALPFVIAIIFLLVIIEFVIPILKRKKPKQKR
jgi:signal peptidase I